MSAARVTAAAFFDGTAIFDAAGLVDAVDAFCDTIGFTPAQTERIFTEARRLGLPVKLHAEQLSNMHGAALAAEFGGLSADHLEHVDEAGVMAMAKAGTVAVMLPGAYYFLRDTHVPPIELFRRHGVPMAVATDCNPGSSPTTHLPLMMNMACTLFRMTPAEALLGVTRHAASALDLLDSRGTIELARRESAIAVAHAAVLYADQRPYVFVLDAGIARQVWVAIGMDDGAHSEITAGLAAGDAVVILGNYELKDGMRAVAAAAPSGEPLSPETQ